MHPPAPLPIENVKELHGSSLPLSGSDTLSGGAKIVGSIKTDHDLFIDCNFEGEIQSAAVLTIGKNAEVRGEIKSQSVIVYGRVTGNIKAGQRCELKATCVFAGDVTAACLVVEDGAAFIGDSVTASLSLHAKKAPLTPGEADQCLRIDINEPYQVEYWAHYFGVSPQQLKQAMEQSGREL